MKRLKIRHIHARPDEHVRVHRPPPAPANLLGGLLGFLGPMGALAGGVLAVWAAFKLVAFVLGLIAALLKVVCVLLVAYFAFRLFVD